VISGKVGLWEAWPELRNALATVHRLVMCASPATAAAVVKRCAPLMKAQRYSLADLYVAA
jgi:hypothetical protein